MCLEDVLGKATHSVNVAIVVDETMVCTLMDHVCLRHKDVLLLDVLPSGSQHLVLCFYHATNHIYLSWWDGNLTSEVWESVVKSDHPRFELSFTCREDVDQVLSPFKTVHTRVHPLVERVPIFIQNQLWQCCLEGLDDLLTVSVSQEFQVRVGGVVAIRSIKDWL